MLIVLSIILCVFLTILGRMIYKTIINPVSIYNIAWGFCMGCHVLLVRNYGISNVSDQMIICVILSCIAFSVACLGYLASKKENKNIKRILPKEEIYINYNAIVLLNVIAIVSILPITWESVLLLMEEGIYALRQEQIVGTGTIFILKDMYKNFVILPVFASSIYLAIDAIIYNTTKNKKKLLLLALVELVLYTLTYFGRLMLLQLFIFIFFMGLVRFGQKTMTMDVKEKRRIKKMKSGIVLLAIIIVVVLFLISSKRTMGSEGSIIYTVLLYFGGPLRFCDMNIQEVVENGHCLYGLGLFANVWDYPLLIFQKISGIDFMRPQEIAYIYITSYKALGTGAYFTGFSTVLLNMFLDGGIIGILVDSILLGIIASYFYGRMLKGYDIRNRLLGFYALLVLFLVINQWDGNRIASIMTFVYFYLYTRKAKRRIKIKI